MRLRVLNNPNFDLESQGMYASTSGDIKVTGTQLITPNGDCNKFSVTITGTVTGTTDDGGGMDAVTFELWDDQVLKDSKSISIRVGKTKAFSVTMGFQWILPEWSSGVGAYSNELVWSVDPFYPTDVQGTCTDTGFYYPLGRADFESECGTWLSRDKAHGGGCYFKGKYHIGVDMMADYDSPVYGISKGTVYSISKSNWG